MEVRRGVNVNAIAADSRVDVVGFLSQPHVEILVHGSGSSGARDDRRYREQVLGYLGFESVRRTVLFSGGEGRTATGEGAELVLDVDNLEGRAIDTNGASLVEKEVGEDEGETGAGGGNSFNKLVPEDLSRESSVRSTALVEDEGVSNANVVRLGGFKSGDGHNSESSKDSKPEKTQFQLPSIGMISGYQSVETSRLGIVEPQKVLVKSSIGAEKIEFCPDDQFILSPIKTSSETWLSSANIHDTSRSCQPALKSPGLSTPETARQEQQSERRHVTDQQKQSSANDLNGGSFSSSNMDIDTPSKIQQNDPQPKSQSKRTPFSGANLATKLSPHILSTAMALTTAKHALLPDSSPANKRQKVARLSGTVSANDSHPWPTSLVRKPCFHSFTAYSDKANGSLWACSKCFGAGFLGEESFNCVSCSYRICKDCYTIHLSETNRTLQDKTTSGVSPPFLAKNPRKSTPRDHKNGFRPSTTGNCLHRDIGRPNSLVEIRAINFRNCEGCSSIILSGQPCFQCRYCPYNLCMICHNGRPSSQTLVPHQRAKAPPPIITDGPLKKRTDAPLSPQLSAGSRRSSIDELLLPGVTRSMKPPTPRLTAAKPAANLQAGMRPAQPAIINRATSSMALAISQPIAAKSLPGCQLDVTAVPSPAKNGSTAVLRRISPAAATRSTGNVVEGLIGVHDSPSTSPIAVGIEVAVSPRLDPPLLPSQQHSKQPNRRTTPPASSPPHPITVSGESRSQLPSTPEPALPISDKLHDPSVTPARSGTHMISTASRLPGDIPSPSSRRKLGDQPNLTASRPLVYASTTAVISDQPARPRTTPPATRKVSQLPREPQEVSSACRKVSPPRPSERQGHVNSKFPAAGDVPPIINARLLKGYRPIVPAVPHPQVSMPSYHPPQPLVSAFQQFSLTKPAKEAFPSLLAKPPPQISIQAHHSAPLTSIASATPPATVPNPAADLFPAHPAASTSPPRRIHQPPDNPPLHPPLTSPPATVSKPAVQASHLHVIPFTAPPQVPQQPLHSPPTLLLSSSERDETPTPPIPSSPLLLPEIHPSPPSSPTITSATEIYPPPPPTDSSPPHLTPSLAFLTRTLPLSRYYTPHILPSYPTRPLRPTERGYWSIPTFHWPASLKEKFWLFMGEFIGAGRAGWGVWCSQQKNEDQVRVYCWGGVVGEVWCLVVCASERAVLRRSGVRRGLSEQNGEEGGWGGCDWVDGGERIVVRMA